VQIELAEALYRLRALSPEHLGDIGVALLSAGADSPAVRELAALDTRATWADVGVLFDRVLAELGRSELTDRHAAYVIAVHAARDIVAGSVTPYEGAARIAYQAYHAAGQPEDLRSFCYWAAEWEDHPEYRDACEADIRQRAAVFLGDHRAPSA
jgi:hypothetical protein